MAGGCYVRTPFTHLKNHLALQGLLREAFFTFAKMHRQLLFLFLLFSGCLRAQSTHTFLQAELLPDLVTLKVSFEITVTHPADFPPDSLVFELWGQALADPHSALRLQLLEEQNTDAHFAPEEDLGIWTWEHLAVNGKESPLPPVRDRFSLPFPDAQDTVLVTGSYTVHLPLGRFTGFGRHNGYLWLKNWAPRLAAHDNHGWKPYPATREEDDWRELSDYTVELTLPLPWQATGNSEITTVTRTADNSIWHLSLQRGYDPRLLLAPDLHRTAFNWSPPGVEDTLKCALITPVPYTVEALLAVPHIMTAWDHMYRRFLARPGWKPLVLLLPEMPGENSTDGCLVLPANKRGVALERDLMREYGKMLFGERQGVDGFAHPWLVEGLAEHLQYDFMETVYPAEGLLGPLDNTFLSRFFGLSNRPVLDQAYQLHLSTARLGLDQPANLAADSYSRLNYLSALHGKAPQHIHYLRDYIGEKDFYRSLRRYLEQGTSPDGSGFREAVAFYTYRPTDWFFNNLLPSTGRMNFSLTHADHCPTVTTVTLRNRGDTEIPVPVTGLNKDSVGITEWLPPFSGKRSFNFTHDDYLEFRLDRPGHLAEGNRRDNRYRNSGLFRRAEPLRLQFYTSLEDPNKTQIFWTPNLGYNAYDQVLLGVRLFNTTVLPRRFEWSVGPDFSTGTSQLTGSASFGFNFLPKSGWFHRISAGVYSRYYHYAPNLAFFRLSPAVNFWFRKPRARAEWFHTLLYRSVRVDREIAETAGDDLTLGVASYTVHNLRWRFEQVKILNPVQIVYDFQLSDDFGKHSLEIDWRYMLIKDEWMQVRLYAGHLFSNSYSGRNTYYNLGLSSSQDYLFDFMLYGRSDTEGIWSQQFFVSEGGFKAQTGLFADRMILSTSLYVPFFRYTGAYAETAWLNDSRESRWAHGAGLRLHFLPDFLEVYFPLYLSTRNIYRTSTYINEVRFVLNLDGDQLIRRFRRGWF